MSSNTNRYSESDLAEFKAVIDKRIEKSKKEIAQLEEQKDDLASSLNDNGYDVDDNFAYQDVEFLQGLIYRQKKHLNDLENALIRIRNKTYGICVVSGQLIDKRRLMAVPTTSKALAFKLATPAPEAQEDEEDEPRPAPKAKAPVIITKIHRKPIKKEGKVIDNLNDIFPEDADEDTDEDSPIDFDFDSMVDNDSYDED